MSKWKIVSLTITASFFTCKIYRKIFAWKSSEQTEPRFEYFWSKLFAGTCRTKTGFENTGNRPASNLLTIAIAYLYCIHVVYFMTVMMCRRGTSKFYRLLLRTYLQLREKHTVKASNFDRVFVKKPIFPHNCLKVTPTKKNRLPM